MPARSPLSHPSGKNKSCLSPFSFSALRLSFFGTERSAIPPRIVATMNGKRLHDSGQLDQWPAVAQQNGWKRDEWDKWVNDPERQGRIPADFRGRGKYLEQFFCGGIGALLGLIALGYWFINKDRVFRTDEEAVYMPPAARASPSTPSPGWARRNGRTKATPPCSTKSTTAKAASCSTITNSTATPRTRFSRRSRRSSWRGTPDGTRRF